MAAAGRLSLRLSAVRVLFLSAVFITLSVYGAEGRQCYWCGPLAEQVHRSRRAPPCEGAARHITVCEPGYDNCAIVATSPPYLESRFCVKFYQDECYPLFCNSTKTWKMTCPCRDDLCNGANAEREEDAFSALSKLLAKTHTRIKKRAPSTLLTGNRKGRIVNPEPDNDHLLTGNSVEDEKGTQNSTKKQTGSLSIDNQTLNKEPADETVTDNTLTNYTTSTSDQIVESEKEEQQNGTSFNEKDQSEHGADIQTIDDKSEPERSSNIPDSTIAKEMENTKQSSTVMIEIDIIQRTSTFVQQTTVPETNLQADEPTHQNDKSEVVNKITEEGLGPRTTEESKTNEFTTSSLKLQSSESIATSHPPQTEMLVNSEEKIETSINVKPSELTSAATLQIVELQTTKTVGKSVSEEQNEMSSTERLSTIVPTTNQVTPNTVSSNVTQSVKQNKNKNIAIKVTINTIIIINSVLLSTFL